VESSLEIIKSILDIYYKNSFLYLKFFTNTDNAFSYSLTLVFLENML